MIDRILKSSKHEEQAFNACAGILHRVKAIPKGIAEEAARKCIEELAKRMLHVHFASQHYIK